MNHPQIESLVRLLESVVHSHVHCDEIAHGDKIEMLDQLCEVKKQFGIKEIESNED